MMSASPIPVAMLGRVFWIKILTLISVIAGWEALARSGLFFEGVTPTTLTVVDAIWNELLDKGFYRDLAITMAAASIGFFFGSLIAIAKGIVLGLNGFVRRMVEPYIMALGGTPKIIFLPILFLIFGLGIESKIAKAALSAFFPVVLSTTSGFIQIPPIFLRVGHSFCLTNWQMVSKIYVPAMADPLLTGLRLGMAMAIIGVLSAEITYSDGGLGYRLIRNADQFKIPAVYALSILIFATAAVINFGLTKVQDYFRRHERERRAVGSKSSPMAAALPRVEAL
jgi:ABC-type nitrate/sulfonate/bicarbonate transport system permease component